MQQAQAEGLTLRVANCTTGYFGVYLVKPGQERARRDWKRGCAETGAGG